MATTWDARKIWLKLSAWQQELCTADPQLPLNEARHLSFHATVGWPQTFWDDRSLSDTLFEITVKSDGASAWKDTRPAGFESTVGTLTFYEPMSQSDSSKPGKPFVSGGFSVSDEIFEDLWERVKVRAASPCDVSLTVFGLEIDPSPGGEDYWNTEKQLILKVLDAMFRFSYQATESCWP